LAVVVACVEPAKREGIGTARHSIRCQPIQTYTHTHQHTHSSHRAPTMDTKRPTYFSFKAPLIFGLLQPSICPLLTINNPTTPSETNPRRLGPHKSVRPPHGTALLGRRGPNQQLIRRSFQLITGGSCGPCHLQPWYFVFINISLDRPPPLLIPSFQQQQPITSPLMMFTNFSRCGVEGKAVDVLIPAIGMKMWTTVAFVIVTAGHRTRHTARQSSLHYS